MDDDDDDGDVGCGDVVKSPMDKEGRHIIYMQSLDVGQGWSYQSDLFERRDCAFVVAFAKIVHQ